MFTLLVLAYYFLPRYLKMGAIDHSVFDGAAFRPR